MLVRPLFCKEFSLNIFLRDMKYKIGLIKQVSQWSPVIFLLMPDLNPIFLIPQHMMPTQASETINASQQGTTVINFMESQNSFIICREVKCQGFVCPLR